MFYLGVQYICFVIIDCLCWLPVCRKDNVLELWTYLLELLRARRLRLELSLKLQKVFQEMLYILDWMDEIKVVLIVSSLALVLPTKPGRTYGGVLIIKAVDSLSW